MSAVASGNLLQRPYARFFWALARQQFSGRLVLTAKGKEYSVRFNRGQILNAHSPEIAESVVKLAAKTGLASSSQITQFLMAKKRDPNADDTDLLMDVAKLSVEQLAKLEVHRIAQSAARTFALPDAQFVCYAENATQQTGVITIEYVIFQGLRRHYDESRLIAELGALAGKRFRLGAEAEARLASFGFGPEAESVLQKLRGNPLSAKELVQNTPGDRSLMLAVLYALWATELLELEGAEPTPVRKSKTVPLAREAAQAVAEARAEAAAAKAAPPAAKPRPARPPGPATGSLSDGVPSAAPRPEPTVPVQAMRAAKPAANLQQTQSKRVRVKRSKVDPKEIAALIRDKLQVLAADGSHYQMLGVERGCSAGELQSSYFKLAKKLHPDRVKGAGIEIDDDRAQKLFARVNKAFSILSDPKKREHYHKVLDAGGELAYRRKQEAADAQARKLLEAEDHFLAGEMAARRNQYRVALDHFEKAVTLNPQEGEHHAYYGWSLWMSSANKDEVYDSVESTLKKALQLSPKCASAYFFAGQLAKHRQDHQTALRSFKKTLELDPSHNDAQLEIRLIRSRGLA